jgi:hypothetical protein
MSSTSDSVTNKGTDGSSGGASQDLAANLGESSFPTPNRCPTKRAPLLRVASASFSFCLPACCFLLLKCLGRVTCAQPMKQSITVMLHAYSH